MTARRSSISLTREACQPGGQGSTRSCRLDNRYVLRARPDFLLAPFACFGLVFVGTTGFDLFFFPIVAFAFGVLRFDFVLITARFRFVLAAANFALAPTVARSGLEKYPFIGLK